MLISFQESKYHVEVQYICNGRLSKPAGSGEMQYRLIVGSKETIGDNALKGHVRMLELPATSSQNASVYRSYDGFGVVKDVIYRERN